MDLVKKNRNFLFQFMPLNRFAGLTHAVVCRTGGASRPPFDGFNLSHGVGDHPDAVDTNRNRLLQLTGGDRHVYTRQNHGTAVQVITRESCSQQGPMHTPSQPADALITDVPGIRLLIQTADCQAVMLYEPKRRVVANVHCGWRGSVADIIGRTVTRMTTDFDCDPKRMTAAIGPSLGPCCAEFVNYEQEIPQRFWSFRVGQNHFDFWRISRHQLVSAGLAADNIHAAGMCTRCNTHLFFSYRAARQTGRFAALIGMDAPIEDRAQ